MKILVLCTGNSCRSQIAAGYLRSFDARLEVEDAPVDGRRDEQMRVISRYGAISLLFFVGLAVPVERLIRGGWARGEGGGDEHHPGSDASGLLYHNQPPI